MTTRPPIDPTGAVLLGQQPGQQAIRIPDALAPRDDEDELRMSQTGTILSMAAQAITDRDIATATGLLLSAFEANYRALEGAIADIAETQARIIEALETSSATVDRLPPDVRVDLEAEIELQQARRERLVADARAALGTCDGRHLETAAEDGCCDDPECWQGNPSRAHDMLRYGENMTPLYRPASDSPTADFPEPLNRDPRTADGEGDRPPLTREDLDNG